MRSCQESWSSSRKHHSIAETQESQRKARDAITRQRRRLREAGRHRTADAQLRDAQSRSLVRRKPETHTDMPATRPPRIRRRALPMSEMAGIEPMMRSDDVAEDRHGNADHKPGIECARERTAFRRRGLQWNIEAGATFGLRFLPAVSIRIPPMAGGGGRSSGASMMRGRSMTGSASSSLVAKDAEDRGNSSTRAVASKIIRGPELRAGDGLSGGCGGSGSGTALQTCKSLYSHSWCRLAPEDRTAVQRWIAVFAWSPRFVAVYFGADQVTPISLRFSLRSRIPISF